MAPNNSLPVYGNDKTMNLNSLILTNIQSSPYFKVNLYELKTYHEVIDEIYYKVDHMEPWEKGSRKTAGQTGMCGGVRGVGAGGIVSSAFCLLYKLFTLKLTRKQVTGLITHQDSPYIRSLGFMYIRYTQPPLDLWEWYEEYLDDEEEIDVKAGGGHKMTIGEMLRQWLTKIEWYSTLFPRIPVPVQKDIAAKLKAKDGDCRLGPRPPRVQPEEIQPGPSVSETNEHIPDGEVYFGEAERIARLRKGSRSPVQPGAEYQVPGRATPPFDIAKEIEREKERHEKSRSRIKEREREPDYDRNRERDRHRHRSQEKYGSRDKEVYSRHRSRSRDRHIKSREHRRRSRSKDRREKKRSRSPERRRSPVRRRSRSRDRSYRHKHGSRSRERVAEKRRDRESSFERDLRREQKRHNPRDERNGD